MHSFCFVSTKDRLLGHAVKAKGIIYVPLPLTLSIYISFVQEGIYKRMQQFVHRDLYLTNPKT
jgi:hypothetical protein